MNKKRWTVASLDLDWVAQDPSAVPNSGFEILANYMDRGGQVLAVWWEPRGFGSGSGCARALVRVKVKA
jgi:hypothetical protein